MSFILNNAETVNKIVLSTRSSRSSLAASAHAPIVLHAPSDAAEFVTLRETLTKKAAEEEMKKRQAAEKAQQKCLEQEEKKAKNRVQKQQSASVNRKKRRKQTC